MNYKIPLEKINKLFNPFNDTNSEFFGSEHVIKDYIRRNDIFTSEQYIENNDKKNIDPEKNNPRKKLAYEIANYEPKEITINLYQENITDIESIIPNNLFNLYAAFYFYQQDKMTDIVVNIEGDKKVIQSLLGHDMDNFLTEEKIEKIAEVQVVNFEIPEKAIENVWSDINYVMKELETSTSNENIINFIDINLWSNKDFIEKILEQPKLAVKYSSYLLNEGLYDVIIENKENFAKYWNILLEDKRDMIKNYPEYLYKDAINENATLPPLEEMDSAQLSKYRSNQRRILFYKVKKHFFDNVDIVCTLLQDDRINIIKFYSTLSTEIRFNDTVLSTIYKEVKIEKQKSFERGTIEPHLFLEKQQIQDYEFIKHYLVNHATKMDFDRILSYTQSSGQIKVFDDLISSFKDSKEKVLELLKEIDNPSFARIYRLLPEELRYDQEIIDTVLSQEINFYLDVPIKLRQHYKIDFIMNGSCEIVKNNLFSYDEIFPIEDKELLIQIIKKGNVYWLQGFGCPEKWQKDNDFLEEVKDYAAISDISSAHPLHETIVNNKRVLKNVIKSNKEFYYTLPEEIQDQWDLLEFMITNYQVVPERNFSSRKKCLDIVLLSPKMIAKVPIQYWYEKEFLLGITTAIDESKLNKNILYSGPKKLKELLNSFEVENNYTDFLSNYVLHQKLENSTKEKTITKKKKL